MSNLLPCESVLSFIQIEATLSALETGSWLPLECLNYVIDRLLSCNIVHEHCLSAALPPPPSQFQFFLTAQNKLLQQWFRTFQDPFSSHLTENTGGLVLDRLPCHWKGSYHKGLIFAIMMPRHYSCTLPREGLLNRRN